MAGSLRDQLVKAGLATAGQAKKAERQNRAEKQARRNDPAPDPQSAARRLKAEKAEREQRILAETLRDTLPNAKLEVMEKVNEPYQWPQLVREFLTALD